MVQPAFSTRWTWRDLHPWEMARETRANGGRRVGMVHGTLPSGDLHVREVLGTRSKRCPACAGWCLEAFQAASCTYGRCLEHVPNGVLHVRGGAWKRSKRYPDAQGGAWKRSKHHPDTRGAVWRWIRRHPGGAGRGLAADQAPSGRVGHGLAAVHAAVGAFGGSSNGNAGVDPWIRGWSRWWRWGGWCCRW